MVKRVWATTQEGDRAEGVEETEKMNGEGREEGERGARKRMSEDCRTW